MSEIFMAKRIANIVKKDGIPKFTYTGNYCVMNDSEKDWRIKFLSSGVLMCQSEVGSIDVAAVGGNHSDDILDAAESFSQITGKNISVSESVEYPIIIGAGMPNGVGGTTSAFDLQAIGGDNAAGNSGIVIIRNAK